MKKMKKGFTIVELVIVIGVIAILSAILIPTFVNLSQKANDARAASEVQSVYSMYTAKYAESQELKEQTAVVIERDGKKYVYTLADGEWKWRVDSEAVKGEQLFDNGDDDGSADSGEIVVYVLE